MKHGDFTALAENYVKYRPSYSTFVRDLFVQYVANSQPVSELKGVDVGAGTGIWTKMLADCNILMQAVEPNDAMREQGISFAQNVKWHNGSAESIGLEDNSCDFVCMASSFHWADYDKAMQEFKRILKPNGIFIALWNPRKIETNQMLIKFEEKLYSLNPNMQRKSSGKSDFCNSLLEKLKQTECVEDAVYIEGIHTEIQTKEMYIGLWESVNDIQVQLGKEKFNEFIDYIKKEIPENENIYADYTTRAWIARIKK